MEIVRTTNAAVNASSVWVTTPNLDLFIVFAPSCAVVRQQSDLAAAGEQRLVTW